MLKILSRGMLNAYWIANSEKCSSRILMRYMVNLPGICVALDVIHPIAIAIRTGVDYVNR